MITTTTTHTHHTYTILPTPTGVTPHTFVYDPQTFDPNTTYQNWVDSTFDRSIESTGTESDPHDSTLCSGGCGLWIDPGNESDLGDRDPILRVDPESPYFLVFCCTGCMLNWGVRYGIFESVQESQQWWESQHLSTNQCTGVTLHDLTLRGTDQDSQDSLWWWVNTPPWITTTV